MISDEYIRGLIEGEGCFTFCKTKNNDKHVLLPAFVLQMHERDKKLIEHVRDLLAPKNKVYVYKRPALRSHNPQKTYKRGAIAMLIVRDFGQLKSRIVPFFYSRLAGHKGKQFLDWIEKIGTEPTVPEDYKLIYRLHKSGFYNRNLASINFVAR